ncbi:hypothetical protein [Labrys wisconsinensis]|uniref:PH domain-containing protein n=1 Tax=Labrys wisconsinensis TaxID=425677 RepID=A0ABU0JGF3_9HYPH|nr:hypothetical protein [Labrys wisconsinensis]MDQ0473381.1 hypothetical protein [Labrys wisconsinensis]
MAAAQRQDGGGASIGSVPSGPGMGDARKHLSNQYADGSEMDVGLLIAGLCSVMLLPAVVCCLRFIYGYRIRAENIEIVLFNRLPVYRIPIASIDTISKASWRQMGIGGLTLRLGNRIARHGLLIRRKNGWLRCVIITPDDNDAFIREFDLIKKHENSNV